MAAPRPLDPASLRRRCDPERFAFTTTADLPDVTAPVGQTRAVDAARFGIGMRGDGYNLFAMGPADAGKLTILRELLRQAAAAAPVPPDVCYAFDFAHPHRPRALRLAAGRGRALRDELHRLVEEMRVAIPAAFEGEELAARKRVIEEETKERHDRVFEELRAEAERRGIAFLRTPIGMGFAALRDGEVIPPDEFARLPESERARIESEISALQDRLRAAIREVQSLAKDERARIRSLLRDVASATVGHLIDEAAARWRDFPEVLAHLEAVRSDVVENVEALLSTEERGHTALTQALDPRGPEPSILRRYLVNLVVDNSDTRGAPVVEEDHPTYSNLVGRIEHVAVMGALISAFHLLRAGAFHRANGGYLVLDARSVLLQPYAWDALKRALESREIRIESLGQILGFATTVSLEPEPVSAEFRVVLLGERSLYHLLDHFDPDFRSLFKVVVDFEDDCDRGGDREDAFCRLVATTARGHGLLAFDRGAVARVIEESSRAAGDAERLSTHMGSLADLLRESDHFARVAQRAAVAAADVESAVAAAETRRGRVRDRVIDQFRRGTILLDTDGAKVGQVNGLCVVQLGGFSFGHPSRITAKVRLGAGQVVDVEREVEMSGPIHSKGVLILSGFLAARYAPEHPLSLSATLVFEQTYGAVEGDSASCAELCALLSALAEAPLSQSLAVTGSVNQHGEVQPVGGVEEKIEGFYDACRARGATGREGALVPAWNAKALMLRPDVVEAVAQGRFRVYAVASVDEALEILAGVPAGVRDTTGRFPADSLNGRVEARLVAMAERRVSLGRAAEGTPR
jgi:lon-related putative ATP-dependent protease